MRKQIVLNIIQNNDGLFELLRRIETAEKKIKRFLLINRNTKTTQINTNCTVCVKLYEKYGKYALNL